MHSIRFKLCIWSLTQHPSAPVVPRVSLPTSRWPGYGYPKNTWTATSFWWIFIVVDMAGNVRGKLSLFWFLFNLLSVSHLAVCHELWYIPTWQIIYGIGKRKVGKPVEWPYRYPILDIKLLVGEYSQLYQDQLVITPKLVRRLRYHSYVVRSHNTYLNTNKHPWLH